MSSSREILNIAITDLNELKQLQDEYEKTPNKEYLKQILNIFNKLEKQMRELSTKTDIKQEFQNFSKEMKIVMEKIKIMANTQKNKQNENEQKNNNQINSNGNTNVIVSGNNNENNSSNNTININTSTKDTDQVQIDPPIKPKLIEGYLKKQGDKGIVKTYKSRYFKQVDDKIYYYKKKENILQPLGNIELESIMEFYTTDKGFDIVTPTRIYHLQEENGKNMEWIKSLQKWKKYKNEMIEVKILNRSKK